MINIVLCDDEKVILQQLFKYVSEVFAEQNIECDIQSFSQPMELLQTLGHQKCDILLLDIEMPVINGMDIAAKLREMSNQPLLIFVTSQEALVYESFQYQPFDFIRKTCYEKELRITLLRAIKQLENRKQEYLIEQSDMIVRLLLEEILYFETCANYIIIVTNKGNYQQRKTMHQLQDELKHYGFIRIHKGYLVNQKAIHVLKADKVILVNQTQLPIGRHYSVTAKEEILHFLRG